MCAPLPAGTDAATVADITVRRQYVSHHTGLRTCQQRRRLRWPNELERFEQQWKRLAHLVGSQQNHHHLLNTLPAARSEGGGVQEQAQVQVQEQEQQEQKGERHPLLCTLKTAHPLPWKKRRCSDEVAVVLDEDEGADWTMMHLLQTTTMKIRLRRCRSILLARILLILPELCRILSGTSTRTSILEELELACPSFLYIFFLCILSAFSLQ
jgi:hypothetical protein